MTTNVDCMRKRIDYCLLLSIMYRCIRDLFSDKNLLTSLSFFRRVAPAPISATE